MSMDPLDPRHSYLRTNYLGIDLPHPLVPGASPLVDDLDAVRQLEDAGAAAFVMHSLFEEQVAVEGLAAHAHLDGHADFFAEASSFLPDPETYAFGPDEYLEQLRRIREAVDVPVFASLNGSTHDGKGSDGKGSDGKGSDGKGSDGWLNLARSMEQAGASGIELNIYEVATDPMVSAAQIEDRTVALVRSVCASVEIPVAVKLSPFYTSFGCFAQRLVDAGARGLVIFNRFYQADIDIENLELERSLHLSDPSELLLRLRWLAILSPRIDASLAITGGVHRTEDVIKAVMAGAHVVQLVSVLLKQGLDVITTLRRELGEWLDEHGYESLEQMRGSMSLATCPDPHAYERANYIQVLQRWDRALFP